MAKFITDFHKSTKAHSSAAIFCPHIFRSLIINKNSWLQKCSPEFFRSHGQPFLSSGLSKAGIVPKKALIARLVSFYQLFPGFSLNEHPISSVIVGERDRLVFCWKMNLGWNYFTRVPQNDLIVLRKNDWFFWLIVKLDVSVPPPPNLCKFFKDLLSLFLNSLDMILEWGRALTRRKYRESFRNFQHKKARKEVSSQWFCEMKKKNSAMAILWQLFAFYVAGFRQKPAEESKWAGSW